MRYIFWMLAFIFWMPAFIVGCSNPPYRTFGAERELDGGEADAEIDSVATDSVRQVVAEVRDSVAPVDTGTKTPETAAPPFVDSSAIVDSAIAAEVGPVVVDAAPDALVSPSFFNWNVTTHVWNTLSYSSDGTQLCAALKINGGGAEFTSSETLAGNFTLRFRVTTTDGQGALFMAGLGGTRPASTRCNGECTTTLSGKGTLYMTISGNNGTTLCVDRLTVVPQ